MKHSSPRRACTSVYRANCALSIFCFESHTKWGRGKVRVAVERRSLSPHVTQIRPSAGYYAVAVVVLLRSMILVTHSPSSTFYLLHFFRKPHTRLFTFSPGRGVHRNCMNLTEILSKVQHPQNYTTHTPSFIRYLKCDSACIDTRTTWRTPDS